MLNYHRNNLEYKRKYNKLEYKNWTICTEGDLYVVIFDGGKYWWDVIFLKETIVCCMCNSHSVEILDIMSDLRKMDLVNINKKMFKLANLNARDNYEPSKYDADV